MDRNNGHKMKTLCHCYPCITVRCSGLKIGIDLCNTQLSNERSASSLSLRRVHSRWTTVHNAWQTLNRQCGLVLQRLCHISCPTSFPPLLCMMIAVCIHSRNRSGRASKATILLSRMETEGFQLFCEIF